MNKLSSKVTSKAFALVFTVVIGNAISHVLLKEAARASLVVGFHFSFIWYSCAILLFGFSFICWRKVLQILPLSFAHPFCALTYLIIPPLSYILYQEQLTPQYGLGILLICIGVVLTSSGASKGASMQANTRNYELD